MASFEKRGNATRAVVRLPGGGKKSQTFDTLTEARLWAHRVENEIKYSTPSQLRAGDKTGRDLFETYLEAVAEHTDSAKWNRLRLIKWCSDPLAEKRVVDIVTHDINDWIARRMRATAIQTKKPLSPGTVRRELGLMSAAFTYAVDGLKWIEVNPCHGALRPAAPPPRDRAALRADEILALRIATGYDADPKLSTFTSRVGACFLLALETGMRSGEILRVRPQDYDRERRIVRVTALERGGRKSSRSGRSQVSAKRTVPLTSRAVELLDQLLATMPAKQEPVEGMAMPPYIVGLNDAQRDALWRKACRQAGVEDLHYHDTKHEAATKLSKFLDVLALSHAIGTKDVRLLRDTYYQNDAESAARLLPASLHGERAALYSTEISADAA